MSSHILSSIAAMNFGCEAGEGPLLGVFDGVRLPKIVMMVHQLN
jgi:hypothetical protein